MDKLSLPGRIVLGPFETKRPFYCRGRWLDSHYAKLVGVEPDGTQHFIQWLGEEAVINYMNKTVDNQDTLLYK